ncbi:hypothetical protein [Nannocystis pusilla]|uniref:Uncharacterized protein n=1 Tax=Nannocystis pusilla TaxID=889268 RepID=A0ABS7TM71_9BACT|nr:hypothetical protein [Nannocystis pusilla]MBZ5709295.1 hypothetical protein [Nannocystis pusilla]
MGFIQTIQKALQESLAAQQRAALAQILRQRASTMTFDDLRQLLSSPIGRGLGPMRIAEAFGAPSSEPSAAPVEPTHTSKPTAKAKKTGTKRKRGKAEAAAAKEQPGASGERKRKPTRAKKKATRKAAQKKAGRASAAPTNAAKPTPPGVSPEKRAEKDRYEAAVLAVIREAGDWIAAGDVRPRVGGNGEALRLALKRLAERGAIVRTGDRSKTRYKIADRAQ